MSTPRRSWYLDTEEFAALWYGPSSDRFPAPLRYTSRLSTDDECDAYRLRTVEVYRNDESLHAAMEVLNRPDVRIEAEFDGARDDGEPSVLLGARQCESGVVAIQNGSAAGDGPIVVRLLPAAEIAGAVAAMVPQRSAGTRHPVTIYREDLEPSADIGVDPFEMNPRQRYERIVEGPLDGSGLARVLGGSDDPRPGIDIQWFDATDDGRYLQTGTDRIEVKPAVAQDIVVALAEAIRRRLPEPEMRR